MKRLRELTWDDYGISKLRYKELKNFCLQYQEKKKKIQYGISAINVDNSGGSSSPGNPTENTALHNTRYMKDIQLIETCARETDIDLYPYIIKSVTENKTYNDIEYDEKFGKIPVGKTEFYAYRRRFYHLLNIKKYS